MALLTYLMWGIAGLAILFLVGYIVASFSIASDEIDANKYLAEKYREEKRKRGEEL